MSLCSKYGIEVLRKYLVVRPAVLAVLASAELADWFFKMPEMNYLSFCDLHNIMFIFLLVGRSNTSCIINKTALQVSKRLVKEGFS